MVPHEEPAVTRRQQVSQVSLTSSMGPPFRPGVGRESVIDHVLVDDHVEVIGAWLTFDDASSTDPTLVASDHFGIAATVTVRPRIPLLYT